MPPITIQQLLHQVKQKIDPLDAELLIAHVLEKPREWVLTHPEFKIEDLRFKIIKKLVARRVKGEPLAYLTGHKEFFGLDFEVNKDVLIPRPDTETMVSLVLNQLKIEDLRLKIILIDVGTGSGCMPIAIANHIRKSGLSVYPYSIIAIDISKKALAVAKRNAKKHGVKIKFLHGDLISPILKSSHLIGGQAIFNLKSSIIITANLPYLTNKQYQSSPSIQHEPQLALVAKNNGLALYKKLLKQIKQQINMDHGEWNKSVPSYVFHVTCFFEIDPSQSRPITRLIKSILPTAKIKITKDLSGLDRIVKIWYN